MTEYYIALFAFVAGLVVGWFIGLFDGRRLMVPRDELRRRSDSD